MSQTFSPKAIAVDAVIGGTSAVVLGRVGAVVAPKVVAGAKALISRAKAARLQHAEPADTAGKSGQRPGTHGGLGHWASGREVGRRSKRERDDRTCGR